MREKVSGTSWNVGYKPAQYHAFADELMQAIGWPAELIFSNTMTSLERISALRSVCEYVSQTQMEGALVECGVWRGGSTIVAATTFQRTGRTRLIEVFDTFTGMTEPGVNDIDWTGRSAKSRLNDDPHRRSNVWAVASRDVFEENIAQINYPKELLNVFEGDIRQLVNEWHPKPIAVLRLDTDWYETTKLELSTFWEYITPGGFVIIDDYGYWQGARQATDEFLATLTRVPLAIRIDYSGVLLMKSP